MIEGSVTEVIYLGAVSLFHLDVEGLGQIVSQRMSHEDESASQDGDRMSASWEPAHTLVLEVNPGCLKSAAADRPGMSLVGHIISGMLPRVLGYGTRGHC